MSGLRLLLVRFIPQVCPVYVFCTSGLPLTSFRFTLFLSGLTYVFILIALCADTSPPAIITDQCGAIASAVRTVFPEARHRFCIWHIMNKAPVKLPQKYREHTLFDLNNCVFDSKTPAEFERNWQGFLDDFELHDNNWLRSIYAIREHWVPAFSRDCFFAGMTSTQRSEGMNAFFDKYLTSRTTLKQFVQQYELALRHKYEKEAQSDFDCQHKAPQLISKYPFERQLSELYTVGVFKKVQLEIGKMMYCDIKDEFNEDDTLHFNVTEHVLTHILPLSKRFTVQIRDEKWVCDCRMFDHVGILCCHVYVVIARIRPNALLPESYIVHRWRKDIRRSYGVKFPLQSGISGNDALRRHDDIMGRAVWIAEAAFDSNDRYLQAVEALELLKERMQRPDPVFAGTSVLNPDKTIRKGRPPSKRRISLSEKIIKSNVKKINRKKALPPLHPAAPKPGAHDFDDWDMNLHYEGVPP